MTQLFKYEMLIQKLQRENQALKESIKQCRCSALTPSSPAEVTLDPDAGKPESETQKKGPGRPKKTLP